MCEFKRNMSKDNRSFATLPLSSKGYNLCMEMVISADLSSHINYDNHMVYYSYFCDLLPSFHVAHPSNHSLWHCVQNFICS